MSGNLSEQQREALDRYFGLMESHPELFAERVSRPIVRDPAMVREFARENGADAFTLQALALYEGRLANSGDGGSGTA